jgi:hypothetical protein
MDGIKTNWDEKGEGNFMVIPPGRYKVLITDVDRNKIKGKDKLIVEMEIIPGEKNKLVGEYIKDFLDLAENCLWKIKALAHGCGISLKGDAEFDPMSIHGKTLIVDVENREYQGKTYLNIAQYIPIVAPKTDAQQDKAFDELSKDAPF